MRKLLIIKEEFKHQFVPFVIEIFRESDGVLVDEKKAKEIYFMCHCNLDICSVCCEKLSNWMMNNFSKEEFLNWNNEYIKKNVEEIYSKLNGFGFVFNADFEMKVTDLINKYSNSYENYKRIIELLFLLSKKIGFLTSINGCFIDHERHNSIENEMFRKVYSVDTKLIDISILSFFPDTKYTGLIPYLALNKYYDLLEKLLFQIIIPYINSYLDDSEVYFSIEKAYWCYIYFKEAISKYYDCFIEKFDKSINSAIKSFQKNDCLGFEHKIEYVLRLFGNKESTTVCGNAFCLKDDIFVTNAILVEEYAITLQDAPEKLNFNNVFNTKIEKKYGANDYYLLSIDYDLDIAVIQFEDLKSFKPVSSDIKVSKGDEVYIMGFKYNEGLKFFTNWYCDSYGRVIDCDEKHIYINAPFCSNMFGAFAYTKFGEPIGIVKSKKDGSEPTVIIPFSVIYDLGKKFLG